jgi:hypothetical protein
MGVVLGLAFALLLILIDPSSLAASSQRATLFVGTIVLTFGIGATLTGLVFVMTEDD